MRKNLYTISPPDIEKHENSRVTIECSSVRVQKSLKN